MKGLIAEVFLSLMHNGDTVIVYNICGSGVKLLLSSFHRLRKLENSCNTVNTQLYVNVNADTANVL